MDTLSRQRRCSNITLSRQRRCSNISCYNRIASTRKNIFCCRSGNNCPGRGKSNGRADEANEARYCEVQRTAEHHIHLSDTVAIVQLRLHITSMFENIKKCQWNQSFQRQEKRHPSSSTRRKNLNFFDLPSRFCFAVTHHHHRIAKLSTATLSSDRRAVIGYWTLEIGAKKKL